MKFRLVGNQGVMDLLGADGTFKSDVSIADVSDYLVNFDPSLPKANPEDEKSMLDYNGETILQLRDDNVLEINDIEFLRKLIVPNEFPYYTIKEFCAETGKGRAIVNRMCQDGRIEGAVFVGDVWYIPKTSKYPARKNAANKVN